MVPLTPPLSPAFAEAATRRQAPGEREIIELFSKQRRHIAVPTGGVKEEIK